MNHTISSPPQKKNFFFVLIMIAAVIILGGGYWLVSTHLENRKEAVPSQAEPINGLIYLINAHVDEEIDGLLKWEKELNQRGITAMVKASKPVLEKYPKVFERLAQKGHELIGSNPNSCWDVPYEEQLEIMQECKDYAENLTGKPMRVFACKYSSYDENTVKAAEALGIPYILARGTEDVRALIYKPREYDVKLLEVSNVEFGDMGRGSLCDISLFARGSTEEDFAQVLDESVAKNPDSMIFVSHPHIGGVKAGYWQVYEDALNSQEFTWRSFDVWIKEVTTMALPYNEIPINREVEYLEPKPAAPLEELPDLPDVGEKVLIFHNGLGPMCKEAEVFLATLDYPVEEHLTAEKNFAALLSQYQTKFQKSEGVSESFGYYPIIFVEDRVFSGFNNEIRQEILEEIGR